MAPKASESKAVTKASEASNLPAEFMDEMSANAGMGIESANADDMSVPFIKCAQSLSPEVDKRDAAYIDGLEVGDFFNSATQASWKGDAGFQFIPVFFRRTYLEWTPRDKGGGFNGEHGIEILQQCEDDGKGGMFLPNGNEIVVTAMWYGLVIGEDGAAESAVISLSKTQYKKSRSLMTKLKSVQLKNGAGRAFNPPVFYNLLRVTSVPEQNDNGKWMGWKIELNGNIFSLENGKELYETAKGLLEAVQSGAVKAARPDEPAGGEPSGGTTQRSKEDDEEIPF